MKKPSDEVIDGLKILAVAGPNAVRDSHDKEKVKAALEWISALKTRKPDKGHYYPGVQSANLGDQFFTSDCANGCGAWMGSSNSGAPDGVDPFGACPQWRKRYEDGPTLANRA